MNKFKIVEDSTEDKTVANTVEDIIKSSTELVDQNERLNVSKKGEKKMSLEMDKDVEKSINGELIDSLRHIFRALYVDIMFDDGKGNFATLDDLCRIELDYDMPNSVDITFASNSKPCDVAEFAMNIVKITDILDIPVFVLNDHEQGSIFNGKDVYSGKDIENVE